MIDQGARNRYFQTQIQKKNTNEIVSSISDVKKLKEENNKLLSQSIKQDYRVQSSMDKIGNALVLIYKSIKDIKFTLPRIFQVRGEVDIIRAPELKVKNFNDLQPLFINLEKHLVALSKKDLPTNFVVDNLSELKDYFESLEQKIGSIATAMSKIPAPKIEVPKQEKLDLNPLIKAMQAMNQNVVPTIVQPSEKMDFKPLLSALSDVKDAIENIPQTQVNIPKVVDIGNFPPQMIPQPVTNININPLQGFIKTTSNTVGTTAVQLPSYGQLFNRRAVVVYNNSNNTIYLGGSDVTTSNGIPVPANSYSNVFDAGYNMILYGIASQGGNNVRVLEVSKDQTNNVQQ